MQSIPPYKPAIHVFGREGLVATYISLEAAIDALGASWLEAYASDYYTSATQLIFGRPESYTPFALRTEDGDAISPALIMSIYRARIVCRGRRWRALNQWNGTGPVPGTGRRRGGHFYRRVRHANERRQAFWVSEDGEVAPRPARSFKNLPDNWDDHQVSARESRSWKRFRKTQYKN